MAWAFSISGGVPIVTQTGTDAGTAGLTTAINAVPTVARSTAYALDAIIKPPTTTGWWYRCTTAGTTAASAPVYGTVTGGTTTDGAAVFTAFLAPQVLTVGDATDHYMIGVRAVISGAFTNANPAISKPTVSQLLVTATGFYTSGQFAADGVTPLYDGIHFESLGGNSQAADNTGGGYGYAVQNGGQFTLIGGSIRISGNPLYEDGAVIREYYVKTIATRAFGGGSMRFRGRSANVVKRGCTHYDLQYDMFRVPTEFGVKSLGSEAVMQYVGSAFGGADARLVAVGLSNQNGTSDIDNYGGGWIVAYNSSGGENIRITNSSSTARHCVPLFQDINFTVTNLVGTPRQSVRYVCTDAPDANSPTTTITTASNLKTWDFRAPITITGETTANGTVSASPVLVVRHGASNIKNLRFPASIATFQFVGYSVRQGPASVVLGVEGTISKAVSVSDANAITLTEAQAAAITGIAFAPSGASGGTVTITQPRSGSEIWHAWRYYKGLVANVGVGDTWEFDTKTLNLGAWDMVNNSTITTNIVTTGVYSGTGSIVGSVIDANGNSYLKFDSIDSWTVYSDAGRLNQIGSGTGSTTYRFNYVAGTTYYLTVVSSGTTFLQEVTPNSAGETVVSLNTAALLIALTTKVDAKPTLAQIEASTVLAKEATVNTRASQTSVTALGAPAQATALTALATANQTEHDATQSAIALIPAPLNSTQTQAAAAAALVAYDAVVPADLAGLALEASVQTRATQASVNALPSLAAIRADIERTGGMLDAVPTLAELESNWSVSGGPKYLGVALMRETTSYEGVLFQLAIPALPFPVAECSVLWVWASIDGYSAVPLPGQALDVSASLSGPMWVLYGYGSNVGSSPMRGDGPGPSAFLVRRAGVTVAFGSCLPRSPTLYDIEAPGGKLDMTLKAAQAAEDQTL